ncbi:murein-DD-endopeptidase. Serine peptidase. MEROPS family S11 [Nitrosomonas cryotolerans]|uniref:Murein-DD-endopeptidase. Serine peptidase. MEROPS family S11 n=1 Tax=Nitrosomonas cryotolerans ATCC 49181 TaxID=1131553 RepID=A0A1N6ITY0_9PROT|nr:D-alanyl-D-alanine endopeptidase [Nitrosomonas cryotolerans]SFP84775.1 murein-DD-endopeptidase. Serine peptidase. MEROPS family S11 [Nitrosomonas cryotolerans]SIO35489.1 murein-DD-endopeptidase. Serine peptidase. MEROPS family S11 [Nitrosomonas cryotolerans ATCC 49181]
MKSVIPIFFFILVFTSNVFAQQNGPDLKSHAAMIFDIQNNHVVYSKNADNIMPIASITKLVTAMVILDARLPLNEKINIDSADADTLKNTRSRLQIGSTLTRHELLRIALMSSENRAAAALGRTYPGGISAFVEAMNKKARSLGMIDSRFIEPTGLSSENISTARDLVKLVAAAYSYNLICELSTTTQHTVVPENKNDKLQFINSNSLVRSENWQIAISKTGFLNEAGRCLVMQAKITGKPIIIILLNSWGKNTRIGDANRVRKWMEMNYIDKQV